MWLRFNVYVRIQATDPSMQYLPATLHRQIVPGIHHSCPSACILHYCDIIPSKLYSSDYLRQIMIVIK
jgi:hypothetical protein